jgi:hypothetical protein
MMPGWRKRIPTVCVFGAWPPGAHAARTRTLVLAAQLLFDHGGARSIGWHGVIATTLLLSQRDCRSTLHNCR